MQKFLDNLDIQHGLYVNLQMSLLHAKKQIFSQNKQFSSVTSKVVIPEFFCRIFSHKWAYTVFFACRVEICVLRKIAIRLSFDVAYTQSY